jgi:hypothetical protein
MPLIKVTGDVLQQNAVSGYIDSHFSNTSGKLIIAEDDVTVNTIFTPKQVVESFSTITGATGTVTHNYSNSAIFYHTSLGGNFTPNFTNVPTENGKALSVLLILAQGATPYLPTSIQINSTVEVLNWSDGVTPAGSANKTNVVSFTMIRSNNAWLVLGQVGSFG